MRFALLALFLSACGATSREPCTQARANEIDLWYQRTVAEKCAAVGYTADNCPSMPEIETEYDHKYDQWVRCK
jgi:hypothetical protein